MYNTKKLKPGLVASYGIQSGNGESLFWSWRFINLSLTYLLKTFTHLLTALGPTQGTLCLSYSYWLHWT